MPLEPTILAYAAGIIDGEGCIRINKQGKAGNHVIRLQVTNTKRTIIDQFKEWFGGSITENRASKYNPKANTSYVWEVSAKKAADVLVAISPYLRIKSNQTHVALRLQDTKSMTNVVNQELYNIREELFRKMRELNKRGTV